MSCMRFNLRGLLLLTAFVAIGCGSLLDKTVTAEIFGILVIAFLAFQTSAALILRGERRYPPIGAAAFGWTYVMLSQLFNLGRPIYIMFFLGQRIGYKFHEDSDVMLTAAGMIFLGKWVGAFLSRLQRDTA